MRYTRVTLGFRALCARRTRVHVQYMHMYVQWDVFTDVNVHVHIECVQLHMYAVAMHYIMWPEMTRQCTIILSVELEDRF